MYNTTATIKDNLCYSNLETYNWSNNFFNIQNKTYEYVNITQLYQFFNEKNKGFINFYTSTYDTVEVINMTNNDINFTLNSYKYDKYNVILKIPYKVIFENKNDYFYFKDDNYNFKVIENSFEEAVNSLKEQIIVFWYNYVNCDPNELTKKAKQLRENLVGLCEVIE